MKYLAVTSHTKWLFVQFGSPPTFGYAVRLQSPEWGEGDLFRDPAKGESVSQEFPNNEKNKPLSRKRVIIIEGLNERGLKVITPAEAEHRAGIVSIEMEDCAEADEFLCNQGIDAYHHEQILRVDPHIFNNREDIDRFLSALDKYLAQR